MRDDPPAIANGSQLMGEDGTVLPLPLEAAWSARWHPVPPGGILFSMWRLLIPVLLLAPSVSAQFVGRKVCGGCHAAQFKTQSQSGHAKALAIAPAGSPGYWAFGAGAKAITYVSQVDDEW